jgi:hypothetical protein
LSTAALQQQRLRSTDEGETGERKERERVAGYQQQQHAEEEEEEHAEEEEVVEREEEEEDAEASFPKPVSLFSACYI